MNKFGEGRGDGGGMLTRALTAARERMGGATPRPMPNPASGPVSAASMAPRPMGAPPAGGMTPPARPMGPPAGGMPPMPDAARAAPVMRPPAGAAFKKGGSVDGVAKKGNTSTKMVKMAKGGSFRASANGIASKGKTRGKMC